MTGIYLEWLKLKKLSHLYEQQCISLCYGDEDNGAFSVVLHFEVKHTFFLFL